MEIRVVFLSRSLDLSGSTTWMNTLIRTFQENGISCVHLIVGRKKTIQSNADVVYYTQQPRKFFKFRIMRFLQMHKIFKNFYNKKEDEFYSRHVDEFLNNKIAQKVIVIKDFSAYLPGYFYQDKFVVIAVLHHQCLSFERKYHFDRLVTVSTAVLERSNQIGFCVEKVIYNPLDLNSITDKSSEYDVDDDNYLLFVGRLHEEKGVYELLEAYNQLLKENKINTKLVFIGEGKARAKIEKYIKNNGLEDKVSLKGFLTNPYPYIKSASLLVLPSYSESMGYVAIEAAVLKTNYLVSNYPAAKEFFPEYNTFDMTENGLFINNLKDKIVQLLLYPSCKLKTGVVDKMNPDTVVKEYMGMLEKIEIHK